MKKFGKIFLLTLVVVGLVISFVGCKAMDDSVAEHTEGADKYEHVWEATYDVKDGKYIRSALQFGSGSDKLETATVDIKTLYPQNGKAGLMFGLHGVKDAEGKDVWNTYVLGIGEKAGGSSELYIYIDYLKGLLKLTEGDSENLGEAKQTSIFPSYSFTMGGRRSGDVLDVTVKIKYTQDQTENDGTYTVSFWDGETQLGRDIEWIHGENVNGESISSKVAEQAKGTIASYGMVSGASAGEKKVDITWNVDKDSVPVTLAAVEE